MFKKIHIVIVILIKLVYVITKQIVTLMVIVLVRVLIVLVTKNLHVLVIQDIAHVMGIRPVLVMLMYALLKFLALAIVLMGVHHNVKQIVIVIQETVLVISIQHVLVIMTRLASV